MRESFRSLHGLRVMIQSLTEGAASEYLNSWTPCNALQEELVKERQPKVQGRASKMDMQKVKLLGAP